MHLYAQTHLCIVVSWWKSIRKVTMKSKYAKMQCPFLTWLSIAHELCISLFVGPKMSIKWLVLHIVDVQISIFHWTLQGFTRLVSCVWILCAARHISILIYGKCYSVVCLTTGTKVHLYLLQKLHNPHTTQGDVHIFRNFYIWFVVFFFNYSGGFFFSCFLHTIRFSTDLYAYTAFQSACCWGI